MDVRPFAKTNAILPRIGQGTWEFPEAGARLREAMDALRRGIALGMNHIDTAEMYGAGRVEEIVGDALAGLKRSDVFLTSKVLPSNASFKKTIAACERSLRRLRTDYLDLYLLHWPGSLPISETMAAMEQLVDDGKVRFVGVSNFDVEELEEARTALRRAPLVCNQVLYHLRERGIEERLLPFCKTRDIAVVAYTPFGRGQFASTAAHADGVLEKVADRHGKTARQVILNFLTRDPNVFTIPKAAHIAHVEENAGAAGWELNADDVRRIDEAFPIIYRGALATL
ncbi:MAG: aldo/keto reductase [Candidatus Eremiobacteraeota bacterium]|nr:aldo/keto reductase [Candidatus Eremiobacteraeota bacterium]